MNRLFRPALPGMDRMALEIERAIAQADGRTRNVASVTSATTLGTEGGVWLVDATGGGVTLTLPSAAEITGRVYTVKKIDASGNSVTIDPAGSETIDGAATKVLSTQWQSFTFQSNGANLFIL